jgi:hypothetical protein
MAVVLDFISAPFKRVLAEQIQAQLSRIIENMSLSPSFSLSLSPPPLSHAYTAANIYATCLFVCVYSTLEDLGLLSGDTVLRNLELRKDVLREAFAIPSKYDILRGVIRELRITIPWTSLHCRQIEIKISNVELVLTDVDSVGCWLVCIVCCVWRKRKERGGGLKKSDITF